MKIIGAGFPRTGTMSMQAALQRLGYPCYHMREVAMRPGHIEAWRNYVTGQPMDWETLFEGFEATADMPACYYFEELLNHYPAAKVILALRAPTGWLASYQTLLAETRRARSANPDNRPMQKFFEFAEMLRAKVFQGNLEPENLKKVFSTHNEKVVRVVPQDRLLVFEVTQGWEPLCAFLERTVPDEDFPRLNEGGETIRKTFKETFVDT